MINNKIQKIENFFNQEFKVNYKFISISNDEFSSKKEEYVENIKNNIKYEMQEDLMNEKEEDSDLNIVNEIFSSEILEIR